MPIRTEKQQLRDVMYFLMLYGEMDDKNKILDDEEVMLFWVLMEECRRSYIKAAIPKSNHWIQTIVQHADYDERRFRSQFRMNRDVFCDLVQLLSNCPSFTPSQEPVSLQVAVGLYRLGCNGNAAGYNHIATKFGICEGSVENFTARLIKALCFICGNWIKWPNEAERQQLSNRMAQQLIPNCVGFVDGSHVPLATAPLDNKETYWSRKKCYCMQFQIVCDMDLLIRDFYIGYPGSVHDAKVFASSPIGCNPHHFFKDQEFIIGDSAYPLTQFTITPFKQRCGGLTALQKSFNRHISSKRVAVENTLGVLKGRFQSLQSLRVRVCAGKGHKKACQWIQACLVLHNILMFKDPWDKDDDDMFLSGQEVECESGNNEYCLADFKRGVLKRQALADIINAMH